MQNHRLKGNNINKVYYFSEKIRSCRVQNWRLGGNLTGYTFIQNLRLNVQKYQKIKLHTSWKSYGHAKYKMVDWEHF